MKKKILTVIGISILAGSVLIGCGSTAQQTQTSSAQNASSTTEKAAGSTVSYTIPDDWEASAVDGGENYTHDGAVIGVASESGAVGYTADDMDTYINNFGSSFTNFKVKESKLTKLAGKNAYNFTSTCDLSGETVSMDTYILLLDSGTAAFTYGAADGNTSYASVFQSVLKSITVTGHSSAGIQLKKVTASGKQSNKSTDTSTNNSKSEKTTYASILKTYTNKLKNQTPKLVAEYKKKAAKLSNLQDKASLSNKLIEKLAKTSNDGVEEMANLMYENGDDYEVYEKWSTKLTDVYQKYAEKITDAYMKSAM